MSKQNVKSGLTLDSKNFDIKLPGDDWQNISKYLGEALYVAAKKIQVHYKGETPVSVQQIYMELVQKATDHAEDLINNEAEVELGLAEEDSDEEDDSEQPPKGHSAWKP